MVLRANKDTNVGGHIASFAVGRHALRRGLQPLLARAVRKHGGDLVFFQGHSAPGVYARAFMLGRLTEEQMDNFRQEVDGKGLSSYPHPG
jgi:pyruvate dehydrogenase E1 component